MISVTRDKAGAIVDGSADKVADITETRGADVQQSGAQLRLVKGYTPKSSMA